MAARGTAKRDRQPAAPIVEVRVRPLDGGWRAIAAITDGVRPLSGDGGGLGRRSATVVPLCRGPRLYHCRARWGMAERIRADRADAARPPVATARAAKPIFS